MYTVCTVSIHTRATSLLRTLWALNYMSLLQWLPHFRDHLIHYSTALGHRMVSTLQRSQLRGLLREGFTVLYILHTWCILTWYWKCVHSTCIYRTHTHTHTVQYTYILYIVYTVHLCMHIKFSIMLLFVIVLCLINVCMYAAVVFIQFTNITVNVVGRHTCTYVLHVL